ncbi:hypothetical protein ACFL1B_05245 [Nanoarchaeota archaeon]
MKLLFEAYKKQIDELTKKVIGNSGIYGKVSSRMQDYTNEEVRRGLSLLMTENQALLRDIQLRDATIASVQQDQGTPAVDIVGSHREDIEGTGEDIELVREHEYEKPEKLPDSGFGQFEVRAFALNERGAKVLEKQERLPTNNEGKHLGDHNITLDHPWNENWTADELLGFTHVGWAILRRQGKDKPDKWEWRIVPLGAQAKLKELQAMIKVLKDQEIKIDGKDPGPRDGFANYQEEVKLRLERVNEQLKRLQEDDFAAIRNKEQVKEALESIGEHNVPRILEYYEAGRASKAKVSYIAYNIWLRKLVKALESIIGEVK